MQSPNREIKYQQNVFFSNREIKYPQNLIPLRYTYIGENNKTDVKYVTCGVPQGSIFGPLLFLVYVNDLPNASRLLDPIKFADDSNLFFNHKDIKNLFTVVNNELVNIKDWFTANKLSLNVEETKYSFFHKPSKKDDIPLRLPKLIINDYGIQREETIKFFGVLLGQHMKRVHKTYLKRNCQKHRYII